MPERHVKFGAANSDAIMSAVVLFFHQQEKLLKAPQGSVIAILVVFQRLSQPDSGDSAFMC
jgi:hypothetical protein